VILPSILGTRCWPAGTINLRRLLGNIEDCCHYSCFLSYDLPPSQHICTGCRPRTRRLVAAIRRHPELHALCCSRKRPVLYTCARYSEPLGASYKPNEPPPPTFLIGTVSDLLDLAVRIGVCGLHAIPSQAIFNPAAIVVWFSAVICGDSTIPERGLGDLRSPTRNTDRAPMDELTFRPSFAYAFCRA